MRNVGAGAQTLLAVPVMIIDLIERSGCGLAARRICSYIAKVSAIARLRTVEGHPCNTSSTNR